ncbi:MAG: GAF domain-containing protein [Bacteroidales bacterium]|nr:GAF domain-containing protein [Bacteroidales bacterium]
MKLKLSLKNKMQLFLISLSVAIYVIAIGYISVNAKKTAYNDSVELVNSNAEKFAFKIQTDLNEYMSVVRTLANAFKVYPDMPREQWDPLFIKMYDKIFNDNPMFYKLWDSWELNAIDPNWDRPTGRITNVFSRVNGSVLQKQDVRSTEGDNAVYANIKAQAKEMVLPIYFDVFADEGEESKLMTSLVSPILIDNEYHGLVGIDLILERFQKMVESINLSQFPDSYAFLLNEEGKYAGHPKTELLNQNAEFKLKLGDNVDLITAIEKGDNFQFTTIDENKKLHYVAVAPINIGRTNTPWFLGVSVPINSIMAQADWNFMISLVVGIIGILLLSTVIYVITKNISDPIQEITEFLKKLALGQTDSKFDMDIKSGDEIEEMTTALKTSIQGLNLKTEFANNIGKGNLNFEFSVLSDEDKLGEALVNMRDSLGKAREDENNRKVEDEKRRWANEGLAKFADILRQNNDNLDILSNEIIKNLVSYLEANQGGLFLLNDEDKSNLFLDMIAAFAYDRKKHVEKRIEYGDGLVGSVAIEKETTYLEDIPEEYISITSGLGGANPGSLLLVPLKIDNKVYGVIEIASFKKLDAYIIEFVEKVAENIASTLSSVKINIQTNELLEKSQQQSEEMSAQEEEMRQNMEELQATQEEASRKNAEMESFLHALEQSSSVVEYNPEGFITKVNDTYLNLLNLRRSSVLGTHHSDKMEFTKKQRTEYDKFWNDLKRGQTRKEKTKFIVDDKTVVFIEVYTPIMDEEGQVKKILKISNNISDFDE